MRSTCSTFARLIGAEVDDFVSPQILQRASQAPADLVQTMSKSAPWWRITLVHCVLSSVRIGVRLVGEESSMLDLAGTIVALISSYLTARAHGLRPEAAGANTALWNLLRQGLLDSEALHTLEQQSGQGPADPLTQQRLRRAIEHALSTNPRFAADAENLTAQAHQEQRAAATGQSSIGNEQHVRQRRVHAGRDVRTTITTRSRNTKIAVGGGGALLAAVALFIWYQYSGGTSSSQATSRYERLVVAACDRIRQDGTGTVPPSLDQNGVVTYHRSDLEHLLAANMQVTAEQVSGLADHQPVPADLRADLDTVRQAQSDAALAARAAQQRIRQLLPATFNDEELRAALDDPVLAAMADAYRRLGDRLTALAGSSCPIEVQAH